MEKEAAAKAEGGEQQEGEEAAPASAKIFVGGLNGVTNETTLRTHDPGLGIWE